MTLEALNKLHQPACNSRLKHRSYLYITLRLWNNLPDRVTRAPSLNVFKTMLNNLNLTVGVKCYCDVVHSMNFCMDSFPLTYFILFYVLMFMDL